MSSSPINPKFPGQGAIPEFGLNKAPKKINLPLSQPHHIIPLCTPFRRESRDPEPARLPVVFGSIARCDRIFDKTAAIRGLLDLRVDADTANERHARDLRGLCG